MSEDNLSTSVADLSSADTDKSLMVDSVVQEAERLLTALSTMCTPDNTDVTIICGERTFGCHSVILKARSMFFFKLLEGGHTAVKIENIESSVMEEVVGFIYTGQIVINADKFVDFMSAASRFELPTLLEKCLKMFRNQISFDNAADVLIVADQMGLDEFKRIAVNKITNNRTMLAADPDFRKKMVENPDLLMMLYDNLCKEDVTTDESFRSQMSSSQTSVSSSGSETLWTCFCGSTVTGLCCPWCGYNPQ